MLKNHIPEMKQDAIRLVTKLTKIQKLDDSIEDFDYKKIRQTRLAVPGKVGSNIHL